jgi:hypothetical protein
LVGWELLARGWGRRSEDEFNDNVADGSMEGRRRKASERVRESTESVASLETETESGCEEILEDGAEEDAGSKCGYEGLWLEHAKVVHSLLQRQ